jgi:tRNA(fMet)-specific endonuclease VapC
VSYLLDTNICIYALNERNEALADRLHEAKRSELHVSAVTVAELLYGAERSQRRKDNARRVRDFVSPLRKVPFDQHAAVAYGRMRAALARRGKPFGQLDMLIAATGLAHGLTVVTNDERAFRRVAGLHVENWSTLPAASRH